MSTPCCFCPDRPLRVTCGVAQRTRSTSDTMSSNSSQDLGIGSLVVDGDGIAGSLREYNTLGADDRPGKMHPHRMSDEQLPSPWMQVQIPWLISVDCGAGWLEIGAMSNRYAVLMDNPQAVEDFVRPFTAAFVVPGEP